MRNSFIAQKIRGPLIHPSLPPWPPLAATDRLIVSIVLPNPECSMV